MQKIINKEHYRQHYTFNNVEKHFVNITIINLKI